ncbi:uncharacterized protein CC84DRAFT_1163857 [Paraphaeosphaeria sporulosa]|uniref:Secreted protein n=1 Tax=Paraphaeosphaeria sporulosa TaxID=1460663 RepID=A0A177CKJ0_9PLEO|nr:uncharacterized protein CC84DRAFT_1163857 [Paraphaeosphaeria sporulosa]OAG07751.1 hypothetical protein CC84DRAFT_1163857 [Paraphaeosphaeria sporulosa]
MFVVRYLTIYSLTLVLLCLSRGIISTAIDPYSQKPEQGRLEGTCEDRHSGLIVPEFGLIFRFIFTRLARLPHKEHVLVSRDYAWWTASRCNAAAAYRWHTFCDSGRNTQV